MAVPAYMPGTSCTKLCIDSSLTDAAILQYSTADNKAGLNSTSTCNNQAFVCLQAADQLLCSAVLLLLVYYVVQHIPKIHL